MSYLCSTLISAIGAYFTVDLVLKVFPVALRYTNTPFKYKLPEGRENKLPSQLDERRSYQFEAVVTIPIIPAKRPFTGIGETFLAMMSAATLCRYNRNESHIIRLNPNQCFSHIHKSISQNISLRLQLPTIQQWCCNCKQTFHSISIVSPSQNSNALSITQTCWYPHALLRISAGFKVPGK